jgi:hypothetical protein
MTAMTCYLGETVSASMLYVPESDDEIDIVFESNGLASPLDPVGIGNFVNYNAAGSLWLLGNNGQKIVGRLVVGDGDTNTNIVALGNILHGNTTTMNNEFVFGALFSETIMLNSDTIQAGNEFNHNELFGETASRICNTYKNFIMLNPSPPLSADSVFVTLNGVPNIPAVPIPTSIKLALPQMNFALPDMLDVSQLGVTPGMTEDQWEEIQDVLNDSNGHAVYFPKGTYYISKPLGYNHWDGSTMLGYHDYYGGWIAGAGKTGEGTPLTIIQRTTFGVGDTVGAVFLSEGMAGMIIQGIKFATELYDYTIDECLVVDNIDFPVFDIEYGGSNYHGRPVPASQSNFFHDCSFEGGKFGLGIGTRYGNTVTTSQCSNMTIADCDFRNSFLGVAIGHDNALANAIINGHFKDNLYAMGQSIIISPPCKEVSGTGNWGVIWSTIEKSMMGDIRFITNAGARAFYNYGIDSNSSRVAQVLTYRRPETTSANTCEATKYYPCQQPYGGAAARTFPIMFEQCSFTPNYRDPKPDGGPSFPFFTDRGAGFIFLHSDVIPVAGDSVLKLHPATWNSNYAFNLHSVFDDWYNNSGYTNTGCFTNVWIHRFFHLPMPEP